jgi:heme-degrading monooxygenase HmoA
MKNEKGFLKMKNTGFGLMHYTLSAWETEEDVKRFYKQGAHLDAMKKAAFIATETKTYTYPAAKFPGWKEAKKLLQEKGKVLKWS